MLQGEADLRCPAADNEQLFVALRALDRTVEYVLYPGGVAPDAVDRPAGSADRHARAHGALVPRRTACSIPSSQPAPTAARLRYAVRAACAARALETAPAGRPGDARICLRRRLAGAAADAAGRASAHSRAERPAGDTPTGSGPSSTALRCASPMARGAASRSSRTTAPQDVDIDVESFRRARLGDGRAFRVRVRMPTGQDVLLLFHSPRRPGAALIRAGAGRAAADSAARDATRGRPSGTRGGCHLAAAAVDARLPFLRDGRPGHADRASARGGRARALRSRRLVRPAADGAARPAAQGAERAGGARPALACRQPGDRGRARACSRARAIPRCAATSRPSSRPARRRSPPSRRSCAWRSSSATRTTGATSSSSCGRARAATRRRSSRATSTGCSRPTPQRLGYQTETLTATGSDQGGFREATIEVRGDGAYSVFKWESGVHRVQRVPETESQGASTPRR